MNRQTRGSSSSVPVVPPPPSPGRARSPGRPKKSQSPSRSTKPKGRPKSATRKSPARSKSPARKAPKKVSPSPNKIINKIKEKVSDFRDSITPDKSLDEVIRASVSRFEEVASDYISSVRRSNRVAAREASQASSDRLGPNTIKENNIHVADEPPKELGNWLTSLALALVLPAIVVAAQIACTRESCAPIPPKVTLALKRFFDLEAAIWYLGFLAVQLVLSALPLGLKSPSLTRSDYFTYRNNGIASLVLTSAVFVGLKVYLNYPVVKILDKGLPILVASILTSLILSALLYAKAVRGKEKRNAYGQTGSLLFDLWVGAEVNPRIKSLDIKTALLRISLLTTIIYDSLLIYKEVDGKDLAQASVNVLLVAGLQIVFALDSLLFESDLLSSFAVSQEGTGLSLILLAALNPFWVTLIPKYLFLTRSAHNVWIASATGLVFTIGLLIHRIANRQKTNFKRDQSSYPSADIVHSRGSSLYKGGLWRHLRHPNYLGALLVHLSWTALTLASSPLHWIPVVVFASSVVLVLTQISRVEARAASRHGTAWNVYSSQVKHKLIPKVF